MQPGVGTPTALAPSGEKRSAPSISGAIGCDDLPLGEKVFSVRSQSGHFRFGRTRWCRRIKSWRGTNGLRALRTGALVTQSTALVEPVRQSLGAEIAGQFLGYLQRVRVFAKRGAQLDIRAIQEKAENRRPPKGMTRKFGDKDRGRGSRRKRGGHPGGDGR